MATYASSSNPFIENSCQNSQASELDKTDESVEVVRSSKRSEPNHELELELEIEPEPEADADAEAEEDSQIVDGRNQHFELIRKLRLQLRDLERYAYEKGELNDKEAIPPSVLAERQTLVLDALKEKLSFNLGTSDIEKLGLEDLKKQVDKEIHHLVDPMATKEVLLKQLQTQLNDLERYITHLHAAIGRCKDPKHQADGSSPSCSCQLHGCNQIPLIAGDLTKPADTLIDNDALPKTSKLIRSLISQLICSDIKLLERKQNRNNNAISDGNKSSNHSLDDNGNEYLASGSKTDVSQPQSLDGEPAWLAHINKVVLATDSLVNLFTLEPQYQRSPDRPIDESFVESIVRRQLTPSIRDLLSYGLVESGPQPKLSYASLIFDPYTLISSLTCFPGSQKAQPTPANPSSDVGSISAKEHVWNVVLDYYNTRNESDLRSSSIKTLSKSFSLEPSMNGPIKITSKQALLITVDDIIETLSKCKPDGPEAHFRTFVYTALNRGKLSVWLRLIFKNKSILKRRYHDYSFVRRQDKIDKFLKTIEVLNQFKFRLPTDAESFDQFVKAF